MKSPFFLGMERKRSSAEGPSGLRMILIFCAGCALLAFAGTLLLRHTLVIRDVRDTALPLASGVAPLEHRLAVLRQEVELAELQASLRTDSAGERLDTYVLPPDATRLLATLGTVTAYLQDKQMLTEASPIDVQDHAPSASSGLQAQDLTVQLVIREEGLAMLQSFFHVAGLLTVADAIPPTQKDQFFRLMDNNPALTPVLESFLNADLFTYARSARGYEERVTKSFSSEEELELFRSILHYSPLLREAAVLFDGELGDLLQAQKLVPLQFVAQKKITVDQEKEGWLRVSLLLRTFGKNK